MTLHKRHVNGNGDNDESDSAGNPNDSPSTTSNSIPFDDVGLSGGDSGSPTKHHVNFQEEEGFREYLVNKTGKGMKNMKHAWSKRASSYSVLDWIAVFLPCVHWLRRYDLRNWLLNDLLAGLSVGAMVIPQGMSYANLAGLPSVFGLYGAFVPVWVYSALGSSRQLAVGPVAVTSMLLFSGINDNIFKNPNDNYNKPSDPEAQETYNHIAIQVAFLAGVMYSALGLLRMGWLTNFLSHAVISGFTTGAAAIIGLSQVRFILGYNRWYMPDIEPICVVNSSGAQSCLCPDEMKYDRERMQCYKSFPREDQVYRKIADLINWHSQFQWREFLMGMSWLVILLTFKELGKRVKKLKILRALGPITVLVIGISITNIFKLYNEPAKIRVVGEIQRGLPNFTASWIFKGFYDFTPTIWLAVLICLIDVMESTAIATTLAVKNRYQLNYTQELTGLGLANIAGSLFQCYTTTGSFSRSAVNNDVGAKTPLAQFVSASLVLLVLVAITPAFTNLPNNVMGAIIISGIIGLMDFHAPFYFWRVSKPDLLVWMTALLCTLFFSIETGLIVSIALSLGLILFRVAFPHTAELGRLPGTLVYRNIKQYPDATRVDGMFIARIDAPLYFANLRPIRSALDRYERHAEVRAAEKGAPLKYMIVDLSPVGEMDGTAVHWMEELIQQHRERGIQVVLCNPSRKLSGQMVRARLPALIGEENVFVRVHDAVVYCSERVAEAQAAAKAAATV